MILFLWRINLAGLQTFPDLASLMIHDVAHPVGKVHELEVYRLLRTQCTLVQLTSVADPNFVNFWSGPLFFKYIGRVWMILRVQFFVIEKEIGFDFFLEVLSRSVLINLAFHDP